MTWKTFGRPYVWHHSCARDGTGEAPCDPPCADPWHVDLPGGDWGASFAAQPDAMDFAHAWATYHPQAIPTRGRGL